MGVCGGGKAPTPVEPVYKSRDGLTWKDPNAAAERDRSIALASAMGYDPNKYAYKPPAVASTPAPAPVSKPTGSTLFPGKTVAAPATTPAPSNAPPPDYDPIIAWKKSIDPTLNQTFEDYRQQGLTASDYRVDTRLKQQEEQAKKAEDERKATVAGNRVSVDNAFKNFDNNYYDNISKTVLGYYLPQLEEQFSNADKQLTFKLARQGLLKSDTAGDARADLQGKFDVERGGITNRAADAARAARENVSRSKATLSNLAETASDPAAVNTQLASESARLRNYAPELTPLGQVFSDYVSPILRTVGSGLLAESQGYPGMGTGVFDSSKNKSYSVSRREG